MLIRHKGIIHERSEDSNFIGALISAIDCKFKCKGCFNRHLKTMPYRVDDSEDIIREISSNPFNEGIILGGLEWSLQPIELLELVALASKKGLKVMIYTGCELKEFHTRIGKACFSKVKPKIDGVDILNFDLFGEITDVSREHIQNVAGSMILDYYIKGEYYIKTGKYERDLQCDKENFGVKLSSENQIVYKILERTYE